MPHSHSGSRPTRGNLVIDSVIWLQCRLGQKRSDRSARSQLELSPHSYVSKRKLRKRSGFPNRGRCFSSWVSSNLDHLSTLRRRNWAWSFDPANLSSDTTWPICFHYFSVSSCTLAPQFAFNAYQVRQPLIVTPSSLVQALGSAASGPIRARA